MIEDLAEQFLKTHVTNLEFLTYKEWIEADPKLTFEEIATTYHGITFEFFQDTKTENPDKIQT